MADWYRMLPGGEMEGGGSTDFTNRLSGGVGPTGGLTAGDYAAAMGRAPVSSASPAPTPMMSWGAPAPVAPQRPATFNFAGASGPGGGGGFRAPPVPDHFAGRLRAVLDNPGAITSDPAYQFLLKQGEQALARSAGAKRMRFAGKTMQDFQDYGQGAASQYLAQIAQLLQGGAQTEAQQYSMRLAEARQNAGAATDAANREDPYGIARRVATQYGNVDDYVRAFSGATNSEASNVLRDRYLKGRRLLDSMAG